MLLVLKAVQQHINIPMEEVPTTLRNQHRYYVSKQQQKLVLMTQVHRLDEVFRRSLE